MKIPFAKYHGLGNDFIVAPGERLPRSLEALARAITSRHTGIGADGFIVALGPRSRKHDARLRFFNADGSEAEMSGNGIRCAAAFLASRGRRKGALRIETPAGLKSVVQVESGEACGVFRVDMGAPVLDPKRIPFKAGEIQPPIVGFLMRTQRGVLPVTVTSMGNPHCTVFVADFVAIDWASLGREIETNELFPNRTNVEFVKVVSPEEIEVRFWERGVGHTISSGTGSCAAVVASILNGYTDRQARVRTPAGYLEVAWPQGEAVTLTGRVQRIAVGTYDFVG